MYVMHIALGGCLAQPPIRYGLTQDTGGHIAYVLGAATAQTRLPGVSRVDILTLLFHDPALGPDHAVPLQQVGPKLRILRLKAGSPGYLAKEALEAELPALTRAFLDLLSLLPRKPDVLHCHFADAAELGLAAGARFGMPVLYTPHSLAIDKAGCAHAPGSPARLERERAAIAGADAIIASSRDEAERQVAAYDPGSAGRVWRVNPGVALPPSAGHAQAARMLQAGLDRPERPFLLAIARPVAKKNLTGLMRAYLGSPALRDAANLVILAGQDGAEPEHRAVRDALAVMAGAAPGRVLLPFGHDAGLVPQLYRLAAARGGVFVNPALHEPFGLTLIEAARFGLPVVATRNGGPADILSALGHGVTVDPRSPEAIARACLDLLGDRDAWARLSQNALDRQGRYDWNAWAARVWTIAQRLTARTAPLRPVPLLRTVLAFDIDGTLTGCSRSVPAFAAWAAGAPGRGQHAVIATGRSLPEARRVLADWSLPELPVVIASVGSEIWRANRRGALALCRDYADWIGRDWQPEAVRAVLAGMAVAWQPAHDQRRWKISLTGTEADARRIEAALAQAGLPARVVASHGRFIDILPARAGKAGALGFEARRLGLTLADCVAAGDSGNDACMLAAAGRAIVVGNALSELRLPDRPGLYRAVRPHAAGVMEGLARFGLADAGPDRAGSSRPDPVQAVPAE